MKKFINYYFPIAIYCTVFILLILSLFFIKRTPETENLVIEYESTISNFIAQWVFLPLFGFAYFKYFFDTLLYKINTFLFKRYVKKHEPFMEDELIKYKIKMTHNNVVFINGCVFILIFVISLCI